MPSAIPAWDRLRLRGGQLLVELPLQPAVEIDRRADAWRRIRRRRSTRDAAATRATRCQSPPYFSASAHQVAKSSSAAPSRAQIRRVGQLATRRPRDRRTPAPVPPAWPSTRCRGRSSPAAAARFWTPSRSRRDPATLATVGELGDGLDAQIHRVDEPARRRQVGRRLHRSRGRGRVQRIDQDVAGAVQRCRPHRQVGEIGEVADAPGLPGSDAVQLGGQAPGAAGAEAFRQSEPGRRHDQRGAGLVVAGAQMHAVVAQRQVGGQHEAGLADPASVQVERRR